MADLNQQAQELAEILERVNDEMRRYGKVTEETAAALKAGSDTRAKELKAGGAAAADALMAVGKAAGAAAGAMLDGKKGAAAFNDSLDQMSQAATAAGVALTFLIPGGPAIKLLVAGVTAAVGAVTAYTKAANDMADKLYKGYSGLAKSGAAASDGMTGVFEDAKKLGLSMNELDGFVQMVGENSKDMALFGGAVFEGRKKFADMGKALEGSREGFLRLGMSAEEQAKASMGYLRLQSQIGQTQNKTANELAESTRKYLVEQDALTKLTGMTREEQEKAREEIRAQERFGAKLMELRQQGKDKEAKALEDTYLVLRSQSKEAAQGFADISTNNVQTEAAQKSIMGTQGESMRVAQQISAGQMDAAEGAQRVAAAHGKTVEQMGATMGQIGTYNQTFGDLSGDLKLKALAEGDIRGQLTKIQEDQAKSLEGKGDQLVNNQAKLIKTQIDANEATERFVMKGIAPAQDAMIKLAEATKAAAGNLNNITGGKASTTEKLEAAGAGAAAGGLTGAAIGSVVPVIGTAVGGAVGAAIGGIGGWLFAGRNEEKKEPPDVKKAAEDGAKKGGRAAGSLGATGKLIEDFGSGTPMTLHGREGVITEDQLTKFAEQAMSMAGNFGAPGLGDGPAKVKEIAKKQVAAQKSILELADEEQDFTEKQNRIQEKMAQDQLELTKKEIEQQKKFGKDRDGFYETILKNIKELAEQTSPGGGGGAGGGGVLGGAIKGAMGGGFVGMLAGAIGGMIGGGGGAGSRPSGGGGAGVMGGGSAPGGAVSDNQGLSQEGGGGMEAPPKRKGGGGGGGSMSEADIKDMIVRHEGLRTRPYKDSLGLWTVGVGHLIGDGRTLPEQWNREFTKEEVMQLFDRDYEHHRAAAERIPGFEALNSKGQGALTDLTFNMGPNWITKWPTLKKQLGEENVEGAADNLEKSKWYGQVGNRAPEVTGMLREGISAADGGMFSGPKTGYPATLHGSEAVIPLKDGNVPAEIPKLDEMIAQNAGVQTEIESLRTDISKLLGDLTTAIKDSQANGMQERMLEVLQNIAKTNSQSADTSHKLLQAARN